MMTAGFVVCFQFNQLSCFLGVAQISFMTTGPIEKIGHKIQLS